MLVHLDKSDVARQDLPNWKKKMDNMFYIFPWAQFSFSVECKKAWVSSSIYQHRPSAKYYSGINI